MDSTWKHCLSPLRPGQASKTGWSLTNRISGTSIRWFNLTISPASNWISSFMSSSVEPKSSADLDHDLGDVLGGNFLPVVRRPNLTVDSVSQQLFHFVLGKYPLQSCRTGLAAEDVLISNPVTNTSCWAGIIDNDWGANPWSSSFGRQYFFVRPSLAECGDAIARIAIGTVMSRPMSVPGRPVSP